MNKKEIASIRRRFAPEKNEISIIRGCYVSEKKEIVSTFSKSPLSLPESEAEHYFSAFKKTLAERPAATSSPCLYRRTIMPASFFASSSSPR